MTAARGKKGTCERLLALCRSLPGATEDVKWGDNLVFSVGGKMFAVFDLPDGEPFSFKVDAQAFDGLTSREGVRPAPYLAKQQWIQLAGFDALPRDVVEDLLRQAHEFVGRKLSKKKRVELGLDLEEVP